MVDAISRRFDSINGSRCLARSLAAVRILGDKEVYAFLTRHAQVFKALNGESHFIRLASLFEHFVINGGDGAHVALGAQAYGKVSNSPEMVYCWLMLADSYIRANHSGGHDEMLGDSCDSGLRIRASRFGAHFEIDQNMTKRSHTDNWYIHVAAKELLANISVTPNLTLLLQGMRKSSWYLGQTGSYVTPAKVQEFVRRHVPAQLQRALG